MTQLKKTVFGAFFALSLAAMSGPVAQYAMADDCGCDKACTAKCEKGDTKDCKCETCKKEKGAGCRDGKCAHKGHKKGDDHHH